MPDIEISGSVDTSRTNVNNSADATFTVLAAQANQITRIHRLLISANVADTITLKFGGTTVMGPLNIGANGNMILDLYPLRLKTGTNEAIEITKGNASTNVTAFMQYTQE